MNATEMAVLKEVWDSARANRGITYSEDMGLSDTCYVIFGTYGMSVWKYRKNKWYRKIVNDWHNLSFADFLKEYRSEEWEEE